MSDIFISYSSKDKEKADQLSELLGSAGLSVWIDRQGIGAATSWSEEIVNALDACKAFVIMLSASSVESKNVVRELALAFEKNKKILPLDIEPVQLPASMQYHLAGLQRTSMTNIDSIIRALGKLGLEATSAPKLKIVSETDLRKSLMILPFEDLSPTADNAWFADGIVSEMISSLSNVKALRVMDAATTKEYKDYKGHLAVYAREMGIRYFVQGDVRKFGDNIKITSRLLDIESGDHLWQDSLKGTMSDIFEIQETVAKKVVDGLNIILTKEEEKTVERKLTNNVEAYELWLRSKIYYDNRNRQDSELAHALLEEAIQLDPNFAHAHLSLAQALLEYDRTYSREEKFIAEARDHITRAEEIMGESLPTLRVRSSLALRLGDYDEALQLANKAIKIDSRYAPAYETVGLASQAQGKLREALDGWKHFVEYNTNDMNGHFNYLIALHEVGDEEALVEYAQKTRLIYERHLRLNPGHLYAHVSYATILGWANDHEGALAEARKLAATEGLDGPGLYNLACIFLHESDYQSGLSVLRKSINAGFYDLQALRHDPDLNPLRGMPEFEELMKISEP